MKISIKTTILCTLVALSVSFLGCETEPSEQIALQISPNMVTLRVGESQEFVASGFKDYTWEIIQTEEIYKPGVLSTKKGERTVFTAGPGGPGGNPSEGYWEPLVVTLRVSGIPLVSTSGSTDPPDTDNAREGAFLVYAEALITIHPQFPDTSYPPASPDPDEAWEPDPSERGE